MKKIITIICVISIILTTVVFSVSAAEIGFDTVQNENPIAKKEESEVVPEEDTIAPVEEIIEADTSASVEETTKVETVKPKKEFVTDSSYYGLLHGPHEVDTSYNPIAYEDLPPEVQAWLDEMKAEEARIQAEQEEVNRKLAETMKFDPFDTVNFLNDLDKYMSAEVYKKAEAMIMAEVAEISVKQNTKAAQVSINAEGKLTTDEKIVLSEETIVKLATLYYETYSNYIKSINKPYFADLPFSFCEYFEKEGCWFVYFQNDYFKNPARGFRSFAVVVRDNGELIGIGE